MSVRVCCTHLFSFFPLVFVLVNALFSGSCFCLCCCLFLSVVCTCILCLLPCLTRCSFTDVLSCTTTGVSQINHLTCYTVFRGFLDFYSCLCVAYGKSHLACVGDSSLSCCTCVHYFERYLTTLCTDSEDAV